MDDTILNFNYPTDTPKIIKVIGVGGGGGNAVTHMYKEGIHDVTFVLCNTDNQALNRSDVPIKLLLGREITQDDYENLDSPYNLYQYTGLPPTPIANPGYAAIYAALNPADTNYYFYVLGPDGHHIFNETLQGHQNTIANLG